MGSVHVPTAEVPLTNLHRGEILDGRTLPIRYTAYTPCFRSEAGSYGADVRGLIRQHQFDKVELMVFSTAEASMRNWNDSPATPRRSQAVGAPVSHDAAVHGRHGLRLGEDLRHRVWLPSQHVYREISSCSNTEAFQARRANISTGLPGRARRSSPTP